MHHHRDSLSVRLTAVLLCACLLTGFFLAPAAQSGEYFDPDAEPQEQTAIPAESGKHPEEKQVLIFLKEDLPENRPYTMDGTKYQRDIAVPVLSGGNRR